MNCESDKQKNPVFQQDLTQKEPPGYTFIMTLFMREMCAMPDKAHMTSILQNHLGSGECFAYSENAAGFAPESYKVEFKQGTIPPQLMITGCTERNAGLIDAMTVSQMWDCQEDRERILEECQYQVLAADMLAASMDYKQRADMLMNFLEALIELYPTCEAVYFTNSGKMFTADRIRNHTIPKDRRFLYFAVNVRFFNIEGSADKVIDTLGMSTLFLPDLQYHFHGMEPDWIVNHAYNMLSYIFDSKNPIENDDHIDGVNSQSGRMDADVQWKCHYENALIQPAREVIDICMNEHAAGGRNYE
ncbi:MAG: DUF4261 domain-containing protein [Lachnospiraceae bacterium]|nr:DUF4261 domain-containing protein [Lachnospiraceae bacterium]